VDEGAIPFCFAMCVTACSELCAVNWASRQDERALKKSRLFWPDVMPGEPNSLSQRSVQLTNY
jgi:hypothetical protein